MQLKVGIDLVNLPRFKSKIAKRHLILDKIFSHSELKSKEEHLAGIFAAKEATIKALGLLPGSWHHIEVVYKKSGKPSLVLTGDFAKKVESFDLSIAHEKDYLIAIVVVIFK